MATKPRLTAVERKRRKKIRELIREARDSPKYRRLHNERVNTARLLDELADVAEQYLKVMKHG